MTSDYDRYRQRLEQQLRADVELLFEAYRAKLRAYETVARSRGEIGSGEDPWPALDLPANLLPPAPGAALPPAGAPAPAPASAPRGRRRAEALTVREAIDEALLKVGETFDRRDLIRALGFTPHRSTFHRTMIDLVYEGTLEITQRGAGTIPSVYRKRSPATAAADTD